MRTYSLDSTSLTGFVRLSAVAASAAAIVTTLLLSPPALAGEFTEYDGSGPLFASVRATDESGSAVARAPKTQERLQQAAQAGNIMTDASVAAAPHLGDGEILSLRYSGRPSR